jgi:hypothetical protein
MFSDLAGKNGGARRMFDAYGDESCGQEYVAYGVLVVPEDQAALAEAAVARIKVQFGGAPGHRLHCRELFHGSARAKSPWATLSVTEVFQLYELLLTELNGLKLRRLVAFARKAELPGGIPALALQHVDPAANLPPRYTKPFPYGDKQIAIHCARATMVPLARYPGLDNVRFWPDPESTVVDWFGGRRAVQGELGNFFVDLGPGKEPPKVNLMLAEGVKPQMLDVADVVACAFQRSKSAKRSPNDQRFKALARLINVEQIRLGVAPNGGLAFQIPNATLLYQPND